MIERRHLRPTAVVPVWGLATLTVLLLAGCTEKLPAKPRLEPTPKIQRATATADASGKKVLLVHSYHQEYPWDQAITQAVESTLKQESVALDVFYMDTKRKTDEAWMIHAGELASQRLQEYKPDVVITADDNAQEYFAKKYLDGPIPFVFCGVNVDPGKYGFPAANVTGIIERPHLKACLDLAGDLGLPIRRLAVLSCDDATSVGAFTFMKEEYPDAEIVSWDLINDFDQWKAAVLRYNDTVDAFAVYMYHTLTQQGSTDSLDPKIVMNWTIENAKIPTLGFFDFGIEDGLLAGVVESGHEQGEKAAEYAIEILQGVPVTSLPVIKAHVGTKMVNRNTAARLGVSFSKQALRDVAVVPER